MRHQSDPSTLDSPLSELIAITGATGNVGHEIAARLLAAGRKVVAIARTASKLEELAKKGAEVRPGSLEDAASVKEALRGATAVFAMVPPNRSFDDQDGFARRIAENIATAIPGSNITRVVTLSSCGIDLGLESNHQIFESVFDAVPGLHRVHLRPGLFMEFFLRQIDLIKREGVNRSYLHPDFPLSMVAARDIGAAGAEHLLRGDFEGRTLHYLLGPRDLTMPQATTILGKSVGLPDLKFVPYTEEEIRKRMLGLGFSQNYVDHYVETRTIYNAAGQMSKQTRSPANSTPTTLEEFAEKVFAPAFRARA